MRDPIRSLAWLGALRTTGLLGVVALLALAPVADGTEERYHEGLLWRVAKPGLPDSFVFGTIHVSDPRVRPIPTAVEKALARSRVLAMEALPGRADAREFDAELFDDEHRLQSLIGARAFAKLVHELRAREVPEDVIHRLKPWAAMLRLVADKSDVEGATLDQELLHAARTRGLRVLALESVADQVLAFEAVPLDSQVALLLHSLAYRDALAAIHESAIRAWLAADLAHLALAHLRIDREFPGMGHHYRQLAERVIADRTVSMHHWLFLPMRAGGVFVAMGAAHLFGRNGLLALLERDGYEVTRIR